MTFDLVTQAALLRVQQQLDSNPSAEQIALILHGLAALREASSPRVLQSLDITNDADVAKPSYALPALSGDVQLVVVNGQVIRHKFWTWNQTLKALVLNFGYRFQAGQTVELYYLPK
jgi:hypothetical protein